MLKRSLFDNIIERLQISPAVALLGCRQVGKTTLAQQIADAFKKPCVYLDLQDRDARANFDEPSLYFQRQEGKLLILDEIHKVPELFSTMRGVIDKRRREGNPNAHFLILGSASPALLKQSSESLAGRISYLELNPFSLKEVEGKYPDACNRLWIHGGFPRAFLSDNSTESMLWRKDFVQTYIERDLPDLGYNLPSERIYNLWRMLALSQGATVNYSTLAGNLDISANTVHNYIDVLAGLYLVRCLRPWYGNTRKRLVKMPKIYVRDSGITHLLAGIKSIDEIVSHPIYGASWEGFVIEQISNYLPYGAQMSFYRSGAGAEIDLVIENIKCGICAIEIKRTQRPSITKSFKMACEEIKATKRYYIIPEGEAYPMDKETDAIGLSEFLKLLPTLI